MLCCQLQLPHPIYPPLSLIRFGPHRSNPPPFPTSSPEHAHSGKDITTLRARSSQECRELRTRTTNDEATGRLGVGTNRHALAGRHESSARDLCDEHTKVNEQGGGGPRVPVTLHVRQHKPRNTRTQCRRMHSTRLALSHPFLPRSSPSSPITT